MYSRTGSGDWSQKMPRANLSELYILRVTAPVAIAAAKGRSKSMQ
jgi:hypothetical protein